MPIQNLSDTLEEFIKWARGVFGAAQDEVTGSIDKTVDAILDIKEMDCGGEWTVYIKTAIPALKETMWLFIIPSFGEILENYLEPKAGRRGARRGRRGDRERRPNRGGGMRLFLKPPIPDVDDLIADRIPGRGFFKGRSAGPGEWLFWTGINVADSVLWHWLLLKASETFVTEWQSGIIESGQCVRGGAGYAKVKTGVSSGNNFAACWADHTTLPVALEKNMTVSNDGDIVMDPEGTVAKGFCAASVTYTLENQNPTETAIFQIGFGLYYQHPTEGLILLIERGATVHIPPNQTVTQEVTGFGQYPLGVAWHMNYRRVNVATIGPVISEATARMEVQAEAIASV